MNLSREIRRFGRKAKRYFPDIAFGVGVCLTASGVYHLVKESRNDPGDGALAEINSDWRDAKKNAEGKPAIEKAKILGGVSVTNTCKFVKVYHGPVIEYVVGQALCCGAYTYRRRELIMVENSLAASAAMLAGVQKRIEERFGPDMAHDILYDVRPTQDQHPDGTVDEHTKMLPGEGNDELVFIFNKENRYWARGMTNDQAFQMLKDSLYTLQERYARKSTDILFLNDMRKEVGAPLTAFGQTNGMSKVLNPDGVPSFGWEREDMKHHIRQFVNGEVDWIPIEFSCDGYVLEQLKKEK